MVQIHQMYPDRIVFFYALVELPYPFKPFIVEIPDISGNIITHTGFIIIGHPAEGMCGFANKPTTLMVSNAELPGWREQPDLLGDFN